MSFAQPEWFWACALLPLLMLLFLNTELIRGRLVRKLVAHRLVEQLAGNVSHWKRRTRFALVLLGMACVIVSLAQPQLGYTWETSKRQGRDLLIAVDVSKSMLSNDLVPNRLTRARMAAQDLISELQGDRVGVIAFAGSAFLQAPLTADFSAVMSSLDELDTEVIPRGGTNLAEAMRVAVDAFGKGESDNRALVIFTDGEELDADGVHAAEKLKDAVKIFTVGVGTADGSLIPLTGATGGTDFVKDASGQFVKSRLDEERLRKIAESTGGFYVHLLSGLAEMTQIVQQGLGKMSEKEIDAKLSRHPIERYQWPLGAGLLFLAASMLIGERRRGAAAPRRAAAVLLATFALAPGLRAGADENPDQLYNSGRYQEAQKAYEELAKKNPNSEVLAFNRGAAAYKNKDLDTALKAFSQALTTEDAILRAKAEYNLGNTLFRKGADKMEKKTLEDALAHYQQALKLTPADANAKYNEEVTRALLEKLKQQEEEKKKQQEKKDQQDKKDQDEEKKDQEKKDKEQQKKDQQQGGQQDREKKDGQKDQQGQQDQAKDEQGGKEENQQKDQEKSEDAKDQQKKTKEQNGADQQKKPGEGEPKEQNAELDEAKEGQNGGQSEPQKPGEQKGKQQQPGPVPDQPGQKLEGELKANPSSGQQDPQRGEAGAAEESAGTKDGEMDKKQAAALLESLKNEDDRVRLIDPNERRRAGAVLRDW